MNLDTQRGTAFCLHRHCWSQNHQNEWYVFFFFFFFFFFLFVCFVFCVGMLVAPHGKSLAWLHDNPPHSSTLTADGLLVLPKPKTDFWKRTYYKPLLSKHNGHVFGVDVDAASGGEGGDDQQHVVRCSVHCQLKPRFQFDQAGAILYCDEDNWVKTGLEFVDGVTKASVVVTLNGYSDWSTFSWPSFENEVSYFIRQMVHPNSNTTDQSHNHSH